MMLGLRIIVCVVALAGALAPWVGAVAAEGVTAPVDRAAAAYYPPLMIEGQPDKPGIAVEVLQTAAIRLNRDLVVDFYPFQRAMYQLQNHDDVLMPALFRNRAREKNFQWITKIYDTEMRFLTMGDPVDSVWDASKLGNIGVETGSTGDRYLTELGFENLVRLEDPDISARMLHAGRIDAWMLTKPLASTVWRRLGYDTQPTYGEVVLELPVFLVAGLTFPADVAEAYRETIEVMKADGTIEAIRAKY